MARTKAKEQLIRDALSGKRDKGGFTELMNMVMLEGGGSVLEESALVEAILEAGTNTEATTPEADGKTALIIAAEAGNAWAVEALLAANANVGARSESGLTALMAAAGKGHVATVEVLLAGGADPAAMLELQTGTKITALDIAANYEHDEVVEVLKRTVD